MSRRKTFYQHKFFHFWSVIRHKEEKFFHNWKWPINGTELWYSRGYLKYKKSIGQLKRLKNFNKVLLFEKVFANHQHEHQSVRKWLDDDPPKSRPKVLKEPRIDASQRFFTKNLLSPIFAIVVVVLVEAAFEDASTHHGVFPKKGIQGRQW